MNAINAATVPAPGVRRVAPLTHARILTIRDTTSDDIDGLVELYAGLSGDDRRMRFFNCYQPRRSFFEQLLHESGKGGGSLVALVRDATGAETLVAEATYVLLANGEGEISLVVDRSWRGWLGPYLLDALVDDARAKGVPFLAADILIENARMRRLMYARSAERVPSSDLSVVRLRIATGFNPAAPAAQPSGQLVGTPDDQREEHEKREGARGRPGRAEDGAQRRQRHDGGCESDLEQDAPEQQRIGEQADRTQRCAVGARRERGADLAGDDREECHRRRLDVHVMQR